MELRGFEPLTPSMRTRCATGLRYSPKNVSQPSKVRRSSRTSEWAARLPGPPCWEGCERGDRGGGQGCDRAGGKRPGEADAVHVIAAYAPGS